MAIYGKIWMVLLQCFGQASLRKKLGRSSKTWHLMSKLFLKVEFLWDSSSDQSNFMSGVYLRLFERGPIDDVNAGVVVHHIITHVTM